MTREQFSKLLCFMACHLALCECMNPIFQTGFLCTKSVPEISLDDDEFVQEYSTPESFHVEVKGYTLSKVHHSDSVEDPSGLAVVVRSEEQFDVLTGIALSDDTGIPIGRFFSGAPADDSGCSSHPPGLSPEIVELSCESESDIPNFMIYVKKSVQVTSVAVYWSPGNEPMNYIDDFRFYFVAINTRKKIFWSSIASGVIQRKQQVQSLNPDDLDADEMEEDVAVSAPLNLTSLEQYDVQCVPLASASTEFEVSRKTSGLPVAVIAASLYAEIFRKPVNRMTMSGTTLPDAYKNCFKSHGCIGETAACIKYHNCRSLITHKPVHKAMARNADVITIQIFTQLHPASTEGYTAIGFSFDMKMGEDIVVECAVMVNGSGGSGVFISWNPPVPRNSNTRIVGLECSDESYVLSNCSVSMTGHTIGCKFDLLDNFIFRQRRFDFTHESYFVLNAAGSRLTKDQIRKHDWKYVTDMKKSLTQIQEPPFLNEYTKIHAIIMLFVWLVFVPNAIFFSRYFKESWVDKVIMGRRLYFTMHVSFNLTGFLLMILSNSYILYVTFARRRRWHEAPVVQYHMKVGGSACILYLVQVSSGWVQPIDEVSRRIFSNGHWVVGTSAVLLSFATLVHSPKLPGTSTPCYLGLIIWFWLLWTCTFHLIMAFHFRDVDAALGRVSKRGFSPLPMMNVTHGSTPGTGKRVVIWVGYFLGTLLISGAATVIILHSNKDCNCKEHFCFF